MAHTRTNLSGKTAKRPTGRPAGVSRLVVVSFGYLLGSYS